MSLTHAFVTEKLALVAIDLAGFTRWSLRHDAVQTAELLDHYYRAVDAIIATHGGRVVKFMGDGCFAVFPAARCAAAIDAAHEALALDTGDPLLRVGAAVHVAVVATGEVGPPSLRRFDVFGAGVNHLFRMGGGAGLRVSEPAYRSLPNDRRARWRKDEPPAIYHWEGE